MYRAMVKTEARKRIHRIEENHVDKLKDRRSKDKLLETIFKQMDEKHGKAQRLSEEELKSHLTRVLS